MKQESKYHRLGEKVLVGALGLIIMWSFSIMVSIATSLKFFASLTWG